MEILGLSESTPKPTSRLRELFWPRIDNEVAAITAARNAMYANFLVATITFGFTAGAGWRGALLCFMIGIGVRQLSRAAAITGLIFYIGDFVAVVIINPGAWIGIFGRAIWTAALIGGVRAAFFANRDEDPAVAARIANPVMDITGMSKMALFFEVLPQRAWPYIRIPFLVILMALTAFLLLGLTGVALRSLQSHPT